MAMSDLIFLDSVYLPKIWGGLRYTDPQAPPKHDPIGERLVISAHSDGDCTVRSGLFAGMPLSHLWAEHRELFGNVPGDEFPLQIKLIDAGDDLSVQVHPDARHAAALGADGGKNECWYVLEPAMSGRVVIGHTAASNEELATLVDGGRWNDLLLWQESRAGDFHFIPAGTVHCILAGALIYEVMQPSNTTYRFYDHARVDDTGASRDLHLDEAMAVITVPHVEVTPEPVMSRSEGMTETLFADTRFFRVRRLEVCGAAHLRRDAPFLLASVVDGSGRVNGVDVTTEDHFIVPSSVESLELDGQLTLMVSDVGVQN